MPNESNSSSEATELHDTVAISVIRNRIGLGPGMLLSERFEIGELLGEGGMGSVYAARDTVKARNIAIKVLLPELIASAHARERFMAEAVVSCDLSHPNIVRVYDVGVSGEYLYFSMELLRGQTLRERLKAQSQERLPLQTVTSIAQQMIEALRYAQRFIVHRDIKPENTWLCEDGTVKLMDFGVARALGSSDLTQTGMAFGTPYYVAPEQWLSAKHVDWRADQYSLGVVLYEMLTGTLPIGVIRPLDTVRRDVPKHYAQAVMRAMSEKPEDRWPSWPALLAELTLPARRRLHLPIGFGVIVLVIAAVSLYWKRETGVPEVPPSEAPAEKAQPTDADKRAVDQASEESTRAPRAPSIEIPDGTAKTPSDAVEAADKMAEEPAPPGSELAPIVSRSVIVAGMMKPLSMFQDRFKDSSLGPVMVVIPAGEFLMGSPTSEAGRLENEGPQHRVTVRRFALGRTEVSFEEYDRFAAATGRKRPQDRGWGRDTRPAINVIWKDATAYAEWLSSETGETYRLPTEAEWEYAARAGTQTPFHTGPCISAAQANFTDLDGYAYPGCPASNQLSEQTLPVGQFPANAFGLRDIHGNVSEWIEDCVHDSYHWAPTDGSAWLADHNGNCSLRVMRGGSWSRIPGQLRSANRSASPVGDADKNVGFRLARTL